MRNPYLSLLGTAWRYARQERRRYVLVYLMFIGANITIAMNPLLYGWFINALQREGVQVLSHAWMYAAGYLGLRLLEWSFHGPARVMERQLAFNLSRNYLDELYHQLLHLPAGWHQHHHSGSTINRLRKAFVALREFFQHGFIYLQAMGKFIFSFTAMVYFSPLFGTLAVLLGIFTIWVILQFDKPFIRSLEEVNEKEHEVSSTLFDGLSNIMTVITLRLEKRIHAGLLDKVTAIFPAFRRNVVINEWKWFTAHMLVASIYALMVLGYVHEHYEPGKVFYIGGLVTLLAYVNQFTSVFYDIANQYTQIVQYNTDVQTARSIGEAYAQQHRSISASILPVNWESLHIEHLSFTRNEAITTRRRSGNLHDLNLRIRRGERIALIGESGSGKSTLLALLRGLYKAQPGVQLTVDGPWKASQPNADFSSLADTVTLFPQEPEIFENTVHYNITLGLPFSEEEVMEACEAAQFTEIVAQLPLGLETKIQEKGVNLSGGQKQRLALARGILAARCSTLVLMDEPTSSVDPRTEIQLYDKLFRTFADKAVISSLHRLHLLSQFDYVYIMQSGRIVDEGTFKELKQNSALFGQLWQHQDEKVMV
jgi:ABC-type multidrug transport system fused ATPase/permease subunit